MIVGYVVCLLLCLPEYYSVTPGGFDSRRPYKGNNFLSCYATPKTLNMDVAGTQTPEKLLSEKAAKTCRRDVGRVTKTAGKDRQHGNAA